MFGQSRGFTTAAVAALALGIGSNTAIFSVVNTVLLKPVSFPDPERLVFSMNTSPQGQGPGASPAKFQHWRQQTSVAQDVSAFNSGIVNFTGGEIPEQLRSARVSAGYFRLLGAPVIRGRTFKAKEDLPNGSRTVVLSHGFWTRRFGSDPEIVGKTISLSSDRHVVIGIIGPEFDARELGAAPDIWVAFQLDPNTRDQGHYFRAAGRLKPGISLQQAKAQLGVSAEEYRRKYPGELQGNQGFSVEPVREALVSNVRASLLVLVYSVSFVLLIACANVANLLLARAIGRQREIAIRSAVGAGRRRIIRQLLTESVLLSLLGAALGSVLGIAGIPALLSVNTANLPRVGQNGSLVTLDWRVFVFTAVVTLATSILFGLIPALQASRPDLMSTLKESGSRSGSGFRQNKALTLLVVTEIALAVILLVGAALLIRTSVALANVKPGFDASRVLTMRMSLTGPHFATSAGVDQLLRDGVERLRAIPDVETASATCCAPLEGGYGLPFIIVGRPLEDRFHGGGSWLTVSPGYFDVFRIPVVRGRAFNERDNGAGPPVVMINQVLAQRFWPKGDPVGEKLWIGKA
jgi:putative ABC transport system permease protein